MIWNKRTEKNICKIWWKKNTKIGPKGITGLYIFESIEIHKCDDYMKKKVKFIFLNFFFSFLL